MERQKFLILPGDEQHFDEMQAAWRKSLAPQPGAETVLFNQVLLASWNLHRCAVAEVQLYQTQTDKTVDPLLNDSHEKTYRRVRRLERSSRQALDQAMRQLARIQTEVRYRLQAFPPVVKEKGLNQMPHTFSVLIDLAKVVDGGLKTAQTIKTAAAPNPMPNLATLLHLPNPAQAA